MDEAGIVILRLFTETPVPAHESEWTVLAGQLLDPLGRPWAAVTVTFTPGDDRSFLDYRVVPGETR